MSTGLGTQDRINQFPGTIGLLNELAGGQMSGLPLQVSDRQAGDEHDVHVGKKFPQKGHQHPTRDFVRQHPVRNQHVRFVLAGEYKSLMSIGR